MSIALIIKLLILFFAVYFTIKHLKFIIVLILLIIILFILPNFFTNSIYILG